MVQSPRLPAPLQLWMGMYDGDVTPSAISVRAASEVLGIPITYCADVPMNEVWIVHHTDTALETVDGKAKVRRSWQTIHKFQLR